MIWILLAVVFVAGVIVLLCGLKFLKIRREVMRDEAMSELRDEAGSNEEGIGGIGQVRTGLGSGR